MDTITVWEVSDAPRYQGVSQWIQTDDRTFWQNTADAPLSRRKYSVRNNYNILRRTNRIVLNKDGWVHEQDNQKILRNNGTDKLLVEEKGINSCKKAKESKCAAAKAWWERNRVYWTKVRATWESYLTTHSSIRIKDTVEGKVLHQYLDDLGNEFATEKIKATEINARIKASLERFIDREQTVAQNQ